MRSGGLAWLSIDDNTYTLISSCGNGSKVALFPGPAQLFIACFVQMKAVHGPGNEARSKFGMPVDVNFNERTLSCKLWIAGFFHVSVPIYESFIQIEGLKYVWCSHRSFYHKLYDCSWCGGVECNNVRRVVIAYYDSYKI